jgi:hypothetical protein
MNKKKKYTVGKPTVHPQKKTNYCRSARPIAKGVQFVVAEYPGSGEGQYVYLCPQEACYVRNKIAHDKPLP